MPVWRHLSTALSGSTAGCCSRLGGSATSPTTRATASAACGSWCGGWSLPLAIAASFRVALGVDQLVVLQGQGCDKAINRLMH